MCNTRVYERNNIKYNSLISTRGRIIFNRHLNTSMNKAQQRKGTPVYSGVLTYFPDAINALARCSQAGNDQHNPGTHLHWDRSKSGDELDAMMRHAMEAGVVDDDGIRHSTKTAWRALANLQKELEQNGEAPLSEHNQTSTWSEGINMDSKD